VPSQRRECPSQLIKLSYDTKGARDDHAESARATERNHRNVREILPAAAQAAERDAEVLIVQARDAFCAGPNSVTSQQGSMEYERYDEVNRAAHAFLRGMSKPVVARVNGPAAGGGCILALVTADIVVASTTTRFALREVAAGLSGVVRLLYSVGRPRALFMAMTGAWVPAQQAEDWGLIYKCASPEQLDAEVDAVAHLIEELPPLAVAATKEKMAFALSLLNMQAVIDYGFRQDLFLHTTEDRKEAQRAFLEKRKPEYHGR
jgi:enoyl-CoA hydratase/carnithine racemase